MESEPLLRLALRAAYRGADVLRERFRRVQGIQRKGPNDLVTEADLAAEEVIVRTLRREFPGHTIIAEEGGIYTEGDEYRWLVDPLDGTVNFAHGVPLFAVSIACLRGEEPLVAAVLQPLTGELFSARAGAGAFRNGEPIRVSREAKVGDGLLATGFPYDREADWIPLTSRFLRCLRAARGIRRLGSAAIDLCLVASGCFAGYWERSLNAWDTAAGMLIVREAGGRVTDFHGRPFSPAGGEIAATNGRIHEELLQLLREESGNV